MRSLLILSTLLFSLNSMGAVIGNQNAGFDINLGGNGYAQGGFNRASNIVAVQAAVINIGARETTFRYASGTDYIILASPSKSTLLGVECVCGSSTGTDIRLSLFATDATRNSATSSGNDLPFFPNAASGQEGTLFAYDETGLKASGGKCAVSRILNIDLTANFRGQSLDRFGVRNGSVNFLSCMAYIKEE